MREIVDSTSCNNLCTALYAFEKIHYFLTLCIIADFEIANAFIGNNEFNSDTPQTEVGEKMIATFESLSKELYKAGMSTFLTDRVPGDHETFYSHALRWYYPKF